MATSTWEIEMGEIGLCTACGGIGDVMMINRHNNSSSLTMCTRCNGSGILTQSMAPGRMQSSKEENALIMERAIAAMEKHIEETNETSL